MHLTSPDGSPNQRPTLCLTFDHMGVARDVGRGQVTRPDPASPDLAIGFPRLLGLLERLGVSGTFFVEGWNGIHHPGRIKDLIERGHEVGLHGWVHEKWLDLNLGQQERVLVDGLAVLRGLGVPRPGFRAPGGYLGRETVALLAELGFGYDSSLLDDADQPCGCPRLVAASGQPAETARGPETARGSEVARGSEPALRTAGHEAENGLVNVPFRWAWVDYWQCVLHPDDPANATTLFERWDAELEGATADGSPMTIVVHPFFTAVDDERWQGFERWLTKHADAGVRMVTAGALAAEAGEATC